MVHLVHMARLCQLVSMSSVLLNNVGQYVVSAKPVALSNVRISFQLINGFH